MADVYLHIGLPKTGTTAIQTALEGSAQALSAQGIEFAAGDRELQRLAIYDVLGRRIEGDKRHVAGRWTALLEAIDASSAHTVVVSEELLTIARPREARRIFRSLDDHRLFVVVGLRDLARTLPSVWQQQIRKGHTYTWDEFASSVKDPSTGPPSAGVMFRYQYDPLRALDTWGRLLPPEQIRIVTVPPAGTPPHELLDRFAEAIGAPAGSLRLDEVRRNEHLGVVEVEVLRRLNGVIRDRMTLAQYLAVVGRGLRGGLRHGIAGPVSLPAEDRPWVIERSRLLIDELDRRGYQISGSLADLEPRAPGTDSLSPSDVSEGQLLAATESALQELSIQYASFWKRHQKLKNRQASTATPAARVASSVRASMFGLQANAFAKADQNRLLAKVTRIYVGKRVTR